jgi:hypothetical protein
MTAGLRSARAAMLMVCCSALPLMAQAAPPVESAQEPLCQPIHSRVGRL